MKEILVSVLGLIGSVVIEIKVLVLGSIKLSILFIINSSNRFNVLCDIFATINWSVILCLFYFGHFCKMSLL